MKEMLRKDLIFLQKHFTENEEVIRFLCKHLLQTGFVKKKFCEAVLNRERKFPTGILLGELNIAIPHADFNYVNKSAAALATLANPVLFHRMDKPEESIPVHIVILIAISWSQRDRYVELLSTFMRRMGDKTQISTIYSSTSKERIIEIMEGANA